MKHAAAWLLASAATPVVARPAVSNTTLSHGVAAIYEDMEVPAVALAVDAAFAQGSGLQLQPTNGTNGTTDADNSTIITIPDNEDYAFTQVVDGDYSADALTESDPSTTEEEPLATLGFWCESNNGCQGTPPQTAKIYYTGGCHAPPECPGGKYSYPAAVKVLQVKAGSKPNCRYWVHTYRERGCSNSPGLLSDQNCGTYATKIPPGPRGSKWKTPNMFQSYFVLEHCLRG